MRGGTIMIPNFPAYDFPFLSRIHGRPIIKSNAGFQVNVTVRDWIHKEKSLIDFERRVHYETPTYARGKGEIVSGKKIGYHYGTLSHTRRLIMNAVLQVDDWFYNKVKRGFPSQCECE